MLLLVLRNNIYVIKSLYGCYEGFLLTVKVKEENKNTQVNNISNENTSHYIRNIYHHYRSSD